MSKLLYPFHFKLRVIINFLIYRLFYTPRYPEMRQVEYYYKALSYSRAIIRFLRVEPYDSIITKSRLLNDNSIVIDVGGETGIWTNIVYNNYKSNIYVFEPNPESVKVLNEKFSDDKIRIFDYGLGSKNQTCRLSNKGMASSVYNCSPEYDESEKFPVQIRDIHEVFSELKLHEIDLIKINIEGGEFDLLPRMIESGIAERCKVIRIQFHDWIPDSFAMRKKIIKKLSKTHDIEWSYPLVWESWIRKDS